MWLDSPLVRAARLGQLCVLDGIDRIDPHALLSIRALISASASASSSSATPSGVNEGLGVRDGAVGGAEVAFPPRGEVDLPSGERLRIHPRFRLIALGAAPVKAEEARLQYLNADLNLSYHLLPSLSAVDIEDIMRRHGANAAAASATASGSAALGTGGFSGPGRKGVVGSLSEWGSSFMDKLAPGRESASSLSYGEELLISAIKALHSASISGGGGSKSAGYPELRPTLRHAQRLQATLHTMLAAHVDTEPMTKAQISETVAQLLAESLLVRFQSAAVQSRFEQVMTSVGAAFRPLRSVSPASANAATGGRKGASSGTHAVSKGGKATREASAAATLASAQRDALGLLGRNSINNSTGNATATASSLLSPATGIVYTTGSDTTNSTAAAAAAAGFVTVGGITVPRRVCTVPELVPQPLFHETPAHLAVLQSLLLSYKATYETNENSILLIGNQGVGKNKLTDKLLQVLGKFFLLLD
jgi:hypothetical protein